MKGTDEKARGKQKNDNELIKAKQIIYNVVALKDGKKTQHPYNWSLLRRKTKPWKIINIREHNSRHMSFWQVVGTVISVLRKEIW